MGMGVAYRALPRAADTLLRLQQVQPLRETAAAAGRHSNSSSSNSVGPPDSSSSSREEGGAGVR